jgi:aspartyl-tRNA(Asn)/glutamyl-tRNA(Gln) amidotransferase subunit B
MISKKVISGKIAKEILPELIQDNISPQKVVEEKGLAMISDSASILPIIEELIIEFPKEVKSFKEGKTKLLGFFVGQLMKKTKGKADPKLANKLISEKLNS